MNGDLTRPVVPPGKKCTVPRSLVFFVLCSMISHPGIAAWYDNEVKGNKEGIAYIT
jgi:hypothetical protein